MFVASIFSGAVWTMFTRPNGTHLYASLRTRRKLKIGTLAVLLTITAMAQAQEPLKTVLSVDLKRYVGRWYEIARYPNRFEKKCEADVTASYSFRADGNIEVVNACRQADGKIRQSKGYAKVVDKESNAKLKVTFFWPFFGNYWIVDLDPDYRYAVVSEPSRKYLWILSRTPRMNPAEYQRVLESVRGLGFDTGKLITPKQAEN